MSWASDIIFYFIFYLINARGFFTLWYGMWYNYGIYTQFFLVIEPLRSPPPQALVVHIFFIFLVVQPPPPLNNKKYKKMCLPLQQRKKVFSDTFVAASLTWTSSNLSSSWGMEVLRDWRMEETKRSNCSFTFSASNSGLQGAIVG